MKRRLYLAFLALLLCAAALAGCGARQTEEQSENALPVADPKDMADAALDLERIRDAGVLRIGVTDGFVPLNYREDGEWKGFDAETAAIFVHWIGVEAEFVEIRWDMRVKLLQSGEIDCIWNGMTKTAELEKLIDCSKPYLANAQVMVLPREQFRKYDTEDKCYHLLFAVESGSAAQTVAQERRFRTRTCAAARDALESVANKECDAAILGDRYGVRDALIRP